MFGPHRRAGGAERLPGALVAAGGGNSAARFGGAGWCSALAVPVFALPFSVRAHAEITGSTGWRFR